MVVCYVTASAQHGYWYQSHFINLTSCNDSKLYYVQTNDEREAIMGFSVLNKSDIVIKTTLDKCSYIVESAEFLNSKDAVYVSNVYQSSKGDKMFILPEIIIRANEGFNIESALSKYFEDLRITRTDDGLFHLECKHLTSDEVLDLSAMLHSEYGIKWCEPLLLPYAVQANPLYTNQYYLHSTSSYCYDINCEPAWTIVTGSSAVRVAVIDTGVDSNHEDMSNCVLSGYTADNPTGYGAPQNANDDNKKAHGVACAGIIAAENNNVGIKGVAYGVKILPVNIYPHTPNGDWAGNTSTQGIANAIRWAYLRSEILSCSWTTTESQVITDAINEARTYGRNGKGTIVVCAAGNDALNSISYPASLPGTIAVGAIDRFGQVCYYSNQGPELTLVAFGGNRDIVTTDRMDTLGYNYGNYTDTFGGTSAACPQVAGVVALMLSMNPDLTESEVRNILTSTAQKLPGYTYYSGRNNETGYGLVDAAAAVQAAVNYTISGPTIPQASSVYTINYLPSCYSVSWSWKNGATVPIASGTPSSNSCTISNSSKVYINDVLVATISIGGNFIQTLEKPINSGANFSGTYSQEGGYVVSPINGSTWYDPIPSTAFANGDGLSIHRRHLVTISSSLFSTSTLTKDNGNGVFPASWNHSGSTVTYSPPTTGGPIVVLVTGRNDFGYDVYKFSLALEPDIIGPPVGLNLNAGDNTLQLSFDVNATCDDGSGTRTVSSSDFLSSDDDEFDYSEGPTWLVSVANVLTGDIVYRGNLTGLCPTIPTTGWQPGMYAVQAVIDGTPLSAKIYIR